MVNRMKTDDKTARVSARVSPAVYSTLAEASALSGSTLNQFLVQAALEKAYAVIEHENKIRLNLESAEKLFDLVENPPKMNRRLKKAIKQHQQTF